MAQQQQQSSDTTQLQFSCEKEAVDRADEEIMKILNNQSNLNPDKFSQLISDYRKRQNNLEAEIHVTIKNQIENINHTRDFVAECMVNASRVKEEIKNMDEFWYQDEQFHQDMELFNRLANFKANIATLIDEMKYFLNVRSQIQKMESMFEEENYEYIFSKLMALTEIRDNVLDKVKDKSQDVQSLSKEFEQLGAFEKKFYDTVFGRVADGVELAKKDPAQLVQLMKIIENGDRKLKAKGKSALFKERVIATIQTRIDTTVEERLKDTGDNIIAILEKSKFIINTLVDVFDHVVKCFPPHYSIFAVYENRFKANIEKRILPFVQDQDKVKESYGSLVMLLNWVDAYKSVMKRAGIDERSYDFLEAQVKSSMPFFLDNVKKLFKEYCENALMKDREEIQSCEMLTIAIKEKGRELVSTYPEDIFHFINMQLDSIAKKLKGELYIEYLRLLTEVLQEYLAGEVKNLQQQAITLQENEGLKQLIIFKVILFINNFWRCISCLNETKSVAFQYCEENQQERIENILFQILGQSIKQNIQETIQIALAIIFVEINFEIIPHLFSPRWAEETLMVEVLEQLVEYFKVCQLKLINPIHVNQLQKKCFEQLINLYFEQLIWTVQSNFQNCCLLWKPKYLQITNEDVSQINSEDKKKQQKKKDKGKNKEEKLKKVNFLTNKEAVLTQLEKDQNTVMDLIEKNYAANIGPAALESIRFRLQIFIELLKKPKPDIESMLGKIIEAFKTNAPFILEVGFYLRDDCDSAFNSQQIQRITELLPKFLKEEELK